MIHKCVFLESRPYTKHYTYGYTEDNGIKVYYDGSGDLLSEYRRNILSEIELIADAPVPAGEDVSEEYSELNHVWLIVSRSLAAGSNNLIVYVLRRKFHGREHPDKYEADAGDDEQCHQHQQKPLRSIFYHFSLLFFLTLGYARLRRLAYPKVEHDLSGQSGNLLN